MSYSEHHIARVQRLIIEVIPTLADSAAVKPETALNELGIDSLATVNLMVGLAEASGVDLEDHFDNISIPHTIGDLCDIAALFEH